MTTERDRRLGDIEQRKAHYAQEEERVRRKVRSSFETWDHNDPAQQMIHDGNHAGVERIFGGVESSLPQERQLVQAWRPSPDGTWTLGRGVIHRVHHDDETVTVQFVPDQHRCRLPWRSVKPQLDITPEYPVIRLAPGQRVPTAAEIALREHNANVFRQEQGIEWDAPLPGAQDHNALSAGEHLAADGHTPVIESEDWGIPATTLDALRNRSIPSAQVTGTYGQHFYSRLYGNNFYVQKRDISKTGHQPHHALSAQEAMTHAPPGDNITSHRYIPLHGPDMVQNLWTGRWMPAPTPANHGGIEGPGLLG